MKRRTKSRSIAHALARAIARGVVGGIGALVGCSAPADVAPGLGPGEIVPLESRIDALPGRMLLIPVRAGSDASERVRIELENGRVLDGRLWRIVVSSDSSASSWLAPAGAWRAEPFGARAESPGGAGDASPGTALASPMVSVDLPVGASGRWISVGGARVRLNVLGSLEAPGTVSGREAVALGEGAAREPGVSGALATLLEPERNSPLRRWRYRLLTRGSPESGEPFADPVIETLARQEEGRWSWALRALARADRALAQRVARRLVATADFGAGTVAPAWPPAAADAGSLLTDLLDPTLDGARKVARAEAFLLAQPATVAWVIDDAGTPEATSRRPMVEIAAANLSEKSVLGAAVIGSRLSGAEPREIGPLSVLRMFVPVPEEGTAESAVSVAVGSYRFTLPVLLTSLAGAPPGVSLGPLTPDYTLDTWQGGAPRATDPAWATGAVLLKKDRSWRLFVECARPASAHGAAQEDTVRVWVGPTARPRLVMRVGESGYAHAEQALSVPGATDPAANAGDPASGVTAASRPTKWVCEVPIPDWCIEQDGVLRVGLERTDARGVRSAYPRPMLPWQGEPGRVMVQTGAWEK